MAGLNHDSHPLRDCHQKFCRYFEIAGVVVQVRADVPITDHTFRANLSRFQVGHSGDNALSLHHHFRLPEPGSQRLEQQVYRKPPWAIYHSDLSWTYLGILPEPDGHEPYQVAIFSPDHTCGHIYHCDASAFRAGNLHSLTLFPTDQILLARVLADRQACYLHAAGMILDGRGFAFVGHSDAGKSTIVTLLQEQGEILCDDRVIVRRWPEGFRVHGTWSHGDVPQVSPHSAPLRALLFLEKAEANRLLPIEGRELVWMLPFFIVKPLVTADWWEKILDLVAAIAREVPAYRLQFDRSGRVGEVLRTL